MDKTSEASNDNPAQVSFPGPGPFLLPLCAETVNIVLGEHLVLLQVETTEGQRLDIPLPVTALSDLAASAADALRKITDES